MKRSSQGGTLDRRTRLRRSAGESGNRTPLAKEPKDSQAHAGSILDVCASLRDRPRPIDQYIDYFGGAPPSTR